MRLAELAELVQMWYPQLQGAGVEGNRGGNQGPQKGKRKEHDGRAMDESGDSPEFITPRPLCGVSLQKELYLSGGTGDCQSAQPASKV